MTKNPIIIGLSAFTLCACTSLLQARKSHQAAFPKDRKGDVHM